MGRDKKMSRQLDTHTMIERHKSSLERRRILISVEDPHEEIKTQMQLHIPHHQ